MCDWPAVTEAGISIDSSAHAPAACTGLAAQFPIGVPSTLTAATWAPISGSIRRVRRTPLLAGSMAMVKWLPPPAPNARPVSVAGPWIAVGTHARPGLAGDRVVVSGLGRGVRWPHVDRLGRLPYPADLLGDRVGELVDVLVRADEHVGDRHLGFAGGRRRGNADRLVGPGAGRERRPRCPLADLRPVDEDVRLLVADHRVVPAGDLDAGTGRVQRCREGTGAARPERAAVVGQRGRRRMRQVRYPQPQAGHLA